MKTRRFHTTERGFSRLWPMAGGDAGMAERNGRAHGAWMRVAERRTGTGAALLQVLDGDVGSTGAQPVPAEMTTARVRSTNEPPQSPA